MREKPSGKLARLREALYWGVRDLQKAGIAIGAVDYEGKPILTMPRIWAAEAGRSITPVVATALADTLNYGYQQKGKTPEHDITADYIQAIFLEDRQTLPKAIRPKTQPRANGRGRKSHPTPGNQAGEDSIEHPRWDAKSA